MASVLPENTSRRTCSPVRYRATETCPSSSLSLRVSLKRRGSSPLLFLFSPGSCSLISLSILVSPNQVLLTAVLAQPSPPFCWVIGHPAPRSWTFLLKVTPDPS